MRSTPFRFRLEILLLAAWLLPFPQTALADGAFGTGPQITVIPASSFQPESSSLSWSSYRGVRVRPSVNAETPFVAPVLLSAGAVVDEVRLLLDDSDPDLDISSFFFVYAHPMSGSVIYDAGYYFSGGTTGAPGPTVLDLTVATFAPMLRAVGSDVYYQYYIEVTLRSTNHVLSGAVVKWHREMSPAPATATFNDVPTSDAFFRAIEAFAASGITSGCGGGNFCPNDFVTRAQVAKFLANALGLHSPQ